MTLESPRFYGRRKGRPLRARKADLLQELLPRLRVEAGFDFGAKPLWLEIGFGGGEHLAAQALRNSEVTFIGCEPFINGVASLLDHVDRDNLSNVLVFPDDARTLIDKMPDGCLERCFVLYPDPWPKKRHAERRFIGRENLDRLSRVLKAGGELQLATDVEPLAEWMRDQVAAHAKFACLYDSSTPPLDWVTTRYEQKALKAGRKLFYMEYRRV